MRNWLELADAKLSCRLEWGKGWSFPIRFCSFLLVFEYGGVKEVNNLHIANYTVFVSLTEMIE